MKNILLFLFLFPNLLISRKFSEKKIPFKSSISNPHKTKIIEKKNINNKKKISPPVEILFQPEIKIKLSEEIILNNLKYLSEEFFKLYFYVINYTNTIPMVIAKEYSTINLKILKAMDEQGYKIIIVKEVSNVGYKFTLKVIQNPVIKIYTNNIKRYIKIFIPQENKTIHYYKPLENNTIDDKNFIFFQDDTHWIMATNKTIEDTALMNHSNVLEPEVTIKKEKDWFFLMAHQKKLFFPKKILYKKKPHGLIIKIQYTDKLKFKIDEKVHSNKGSIKIPNIFNPQEILIFTPQKQLTFMNNNPLFISYNNCIVNANKKPIKPQQDLPSLIYLIVLYNNQKTNNKWEENQDGEHILISENNKNIEEDFLAVEKIFNQLKKSRDLKKDIDLFPVINIDILNNLSDENPHFSDYIQMIVAFYYGKRNNFESYFKKYYKDIYYQSFPLINEITHLNEGLFWLMIYILPNNRLSKNNILKMVEYSYGFPSVIRDKINSFIIYHLYLNGQFHTINYIFNNNLVDMTLDFMTNFIYVETKKFNGIGLGDDIFHWKMNDGDMNLLKASLQMEKLLYSKESIKEYNKLLINLKKILFIYKNYKIILTKENQNQLLDLLGYVGKKNIKDLETLTQDSIISMNLIINHVQIYNPKVFKKYYKNYKKNINEK